MLRLKLATDPYWANLAERNLKDIMIDHAFCEQKAASSAISIIIRFPEYSEIVDKMTEIALEEMTHFRQVHKLIQKNGWKLGKERKDYYVLELSKFFKGGGSKNTQLINSLLLSAMIEARSCERFHVLAKNIKDQSLANFYHQLELSEANHYKVFINFAKKYADENLDIDSIWEDFLEYESKVIKSYSKGNLIHG